MGTQKVEAWLKCRRFQLEATDHSLMMTICHRHRDNRTGSLDIRAERLIDDMPYRGRSRPDRMLRDSLRRLVDLQIIYVESNGRRYLRDRWLHITIVDDEFWQHLKEQQESSEESPAQARLLESRALNARPESTRAERTNLIAERSSRKSTRAERSNSRAERASHSRVKISKEVHQRKDPKKAAELQGDNSTASNFSAAVETSKPEPAPRPALVPAATMTEPDTAAAVYNTLDLPPPQQIDADWGAWQKVVSEMELIMPAATYHTWLHGQTEYVESTDDRFTIRTSSAFVREWLHSRARKKMESALKAITGRTVEIEFLTDSQIVEETKGDDSSDTFETLHEVPASEGAFGVPQAQAQQRRPSPPLQSLPIGR